ncbi:MAG: phosphopantothenate/pantothenate synthetase [Thermoplasmata archaeon]|nr:phosphopantothenate/pantothenate synthetase [Thermoplasmata archaeon]MCI4362231.1 phosphopantothenate/pantothenate synthetase [Thermoplasmata archaeon]
MTRLSPRHPRYRSLRTRAHLGALARTGVVAPEGLIAHGRGEAFDYFLGERTTASARRAIRAAAVWLANADHPVVSVNGNVAALAAPAVARLQRARPGLSVEVNLFHRTPGRARRIATLLRSAGVLDVLGVVPNSRIPGLPSDRARVDRRGILVADVCLVPLEDGDRTEALRAMGKHVISIDLNPLSRTSETADLPIVDELTRALEGLAAELGRSRRRTVGEFPPFDARGALRAARRTMARRLTSVGARPPTAPRSARRPSAGTPRRSRRTP